MNQFREYILSVDEPAKFYIYRKILNPDERLPPRLSALEESQRLKYKNALLILCNKNNIRNSILGFWITAINYVSERSRSEGRKNWNFAFGYGWYNVIIILNILDDEGEDLYQINFWFNWVNFTRLPIPFFTGKLGLNRSHLTLVSP